MYHHNDISLAKTEFAAALKKAFLHDIFRYFSTTKNQLLDFSDIKKRMPIRGQHYIGLRQVELSKIIGSVNRYQDFDQSFLPKTKTLEYRWTHVDVALLKDIQLPSIQLYQIGEIYFVIDGNHRVSVAREHGQYYIDAEIIKLEAEFDLQSGIKLESQLLEYEHSQFYEISGIAKVRPQAEIKLTLPSAYFILLEHIEKHRWFLGTELKHPIPYSQAVSSWFDKVYSPVITVINHRGILHDFPNRTESDLYLWINEHRYFLEQETGLVNLVVAAEDFASKYSERPINKIIKRLIKSLK